MFFISTAKFILYSTIVLYIALYCYLCTELNLRAFCNCTSKLFNFPSFFIIRVATINEFHRMFSYLELLMYYYLYPTTLKESGSSSLPKILN